jgi:hypothetical protein
MPSGKFAQTLFCDLEHQLEWNICEKFTVHESLDAIGLIDYALCVLWEH